MPLDLRSRGHKKKKGSFKCELSKEYAELFELH